MAKRQATMNSLKSAAVRSAKLTAASAGGLLATNYATQKIHEMNVLPERFAKLLVSGAAAIGLPFVLAKYGKLGNIWTDGVAAGGGLRFTAELLEFLGADSVAEMLNPLNGPASGNVVEVEVDSMDQLNRIAEAANLGGPTPAIPYDRNLTENVVSMAGRRRRRDSARIN